MKSSDLFSPAPSLQIFTQFFNPDSAPWLWLAQIKPALAHYFAHNKPSHPALPPNFHIENPDTVYIAPDAKLSPNATIIGPAYIASGVEIRQGAYLRGNVIVGARSIIGNSTEIKNSLLLENVQAPHFNYIGDSILGNKSHLGAGVILSNLRLDQKPITVLAPDPIDTGLRKLGALIADSAEVGCNSVLNPGAILHRRALITPTTSFTGTLPANTIAYTRTTQSRLPRQD